jgi:UDP-N-acetylglucosamine--N-acetylmuramyl-(pentapeptide) pyrophosphoryl-undecaprenol N-acetylglucosamine transferase
MDDHQAANAAVLQDAKAAWMVRQEDLDADKLRDLLREILSDPGGLALRAANAAKLGRPDAAARLADIVERLGVRP